MRIDIKYDLGECVYLKTDSDQLQRMIIQVCIRPDGILYELNCGSSGSFHYEIEFTKERDILKATS